MKLSIVVADDHTVVLDGLKAVLGLEPDFEVVALCTDGLEAIEAVETHDPDVLVLDVSMPRCDGLEAYEKLKERGTAVPTVILSATLAENTVLRCLQSGVEGIVLKDSASSTLVDAIRGVARGERCIPPDLAARALQASPTADIELQLLGGLDIASSDLSPNASSRRRHPLALLALVAAAAPQAIGRDKLMALLWPESEGTRASNSLRQTLFRLRKDLGEDIFLPESVGGIQLDIERVRVDLWEFRKAIARGAPGDAVEIYNGPFLDGFHLADHADFSRWVDGERDDVARKYTGALDELAAEAEGEERLDDAVAWRRKQAAVDPYSSRVALALLKALTAAGDRPGALAYASVYENLLQDDLEADPDPAVGAFVKELREPAPEPEPTPAAANVASEPSAPVTPVDPASDTTTASPADVDRHPASPTKSRHWMPWVAGAAVVVAIAGLSWQVMTGGSSGETITPAPDATIIVLGSGITNVAGRDPATQIVECEGPACPEEALPQPSFVVTKHTAYSLPITGTHFLSTIRDGTTIGPPGFDCCSTVVFQNQFQLPARAFSARITLTALGDNQVSRVAVNDVEFGGHPDPFESGNYGGPAAAWSLIFPPHPSGTNRLTITLWNGGGALALQYHAVVTYELPEDVEATSGGG